MAQIDVRDLAPADRSAWDRLWSANCAHYGAVLPAADNDELWRRISDADYAMGALIAFTSQDSRPVGLAHYVLHPHTFSSRMLCYLEDLWVDPEARGGGVGRRLIEALIARGRERGWRRLYWHTEADNSAARALYDRLVRVTDYVRYDVALQ